jgi:hypothetical protein
VSTLAARRKKKLGGGDGPRGRSSHIVAAFKNTQPPKKCQGSAHELHGRSCLRLVVSHTPCLYVLPLGPNPVS